MSGKQFAILLCAETLSGCAPTAWIRRFTMSFDYLLQKCVFNILQAYGYAVVILHCLQKLSVNAHSKTHDRSSPAISEGQWQKPEGNCSQTQFKIAQFTLT